MIYEYRCSTHGKVVERLRKLDERDEPVEDYACDDNVACTYTRILSPTRTDFVFADTGRRKR